MNATIHAPARSAAVTPQPRVPDLAAIRALYVATQEDYRRWSPAYNMHFGYWSWGMNPLRREPMLERLNEVAIEGLRLHASAPMRIADLGCGAGATARALARHPVRPNVIAVTLVREQIELGKRLNREAGLSSRIAYVWSDLSSTWMASSTLDGAIAIESFCYAAGADKAQAIRETARLLRPGSRLVVVDGFLVRDTPRGLLGWIYRKWCDCWSIPELAQIDEFMSSLHANGFEQVEVRDLFWRIAPSAAHIPWVAATHMARELWRNRGRLSAWRWRHIAASWLSIALGLAHGRFRYCMVTATKRS
jgi:SAM-dependent methyltransferase